MTEEPRFPFAPPSRTPASSTCRATTPAEGVLHFVIAHRFGTLSSGAYDLWGLDNAQMRMAFDYGITDGLAVGVARNTYQKTYEANVKARLLRQKTGPKPSLSVTWYSVAMANGTRVAPEETPYPFSRRLSYVHQAVVARKMSERWSLALVPPSCTETLCKTAARPTIWAARRAADAKLGPRFSVNGEYHHFLTQSLAMPFLPAFPLAWTLRREGTCFNCTSPTPVACSSALSSRNPLEAGPTATCILAST